MRHDKEWYTCDRCGDEIKEDICAWKKACSYFQINNQSKKEIRVIENEPYLEELGVVKKLSSIDAITIMRGYQKKQRELHLCSKCRKEFERFMRNEL